MDPGPTQPSDISLSPRRAADFWFDDGSILHVESTQFRVHRSVLSASSEVLQGMFCLPQPAVIDEDFVEGCPVVHLHDKAIDWIHVLKALYSDRCVSILVPEFYF